MAKKPGITNGEALTLAAILHGLDAEQVKGFVLFSVVTCNKRPDLHVHATCSMVNKKEVYDLVRIGLKVIDEDD